jgi:hypothetical protein
VSQLVEKVGLYIKSSMGGGTPPLHFVKIPLFLVGGDVPSPADNRIEMWFIDRLTHVTLLCREFFNFHQDTKNGTLNVPFQLSDLFLLSLVLDRRSCDVRTSNEDN